MPDWFVPLHAVPAAQDVGRAENLQDHRKGRWDLQEAGRRGENRVG